MKTYNQIVRRNPNYPVTIDTKLKELIKSLLTKDVSKRMENLNNRIEDVMSHPSYSEINFE